VATGIDCSSVRVAPPTMGDLARLRERQGPQVLAPGVLDLCVTADCVFVASTAVTPEEMAQIAKASRLEGVEARLSLNLPHILPTRLTVQPLDHLTMISLKSARLSGGQAAAKRAVDILGAAIGLLIMMPVWLGLGLAIRISSGKPILFRFGASSG
jgi:hypothetical protein